MLMHRLALRAAILMRPKRRWPDWRVSAVRAGSQLHLLSVRADTRTLVHALDSPTTYLATARQRFEAVSAYLTRAPCITHCRTHAGIYPITRSTRCSTLSAAVATP